MKSIAALLAIAGLAACAPAGDEVTSLPSFSGKLPAQSLYAGYLDIESPEGGKHLHYLLDRAQSDDGTKPVIVWFTGGPGCASTAAYFTEQGRYHFSAATGTPEVVVNPYAWNAVANVAFIDSPAGVGYSYADKPQGLVHNDTSVAEDSYNALLALVAKFPEFKGRDLWITGESYAGIYVPMLLQQIVRRGSVGLKLRGGLIGNGCIGSEVGGCSEKEGARIDFAFLAGNHLISQQSYTALLAACNNFNGSPTKQCLDQQSLVLDNVGPVDVYDVFTPCLAFSSSRKGLFRAPPSPVDLALAQGPSECFDSNDTTTQYLNLPAVRTAFHTASESVTGRWEECTDRITYHETMTDETTLVYPELVQAGLDLTVYNGNFDLCVPVNGNEEWTSRFAQQQNIPTKEAWRPWLVDGQVQGYVTEYAPKQGAFRFVTVNAAGHMVPQFQPQRALDMLKRGLGLENF